MDDRYCSNCGKELPEEGAKFCPNCGNSNHFKEYYYENNTSQYSQNDHARDSSTPNYSGQYNAHAHIVKQKSPFLAVILSFFWTGLGQLYNGKFAKGILFQIALVIGFLMLIIPGFFVWVVGLWDAYNDSEKMNRGEIPFDEPSFGAIIAFIFFWVIIIFVLILLMSILFIPFAFI